MKKVLTNNIAWFSKFNILAFFNDFLVDDIITNIRLKGLSKKNCKKTTFTHNL